MKRKLKTLLSIVLAASCVLGATACSSDGSNDGRTKFVVFTYAGGYGTTWLKNAEAEYEKLHTDIDIEVTEDKTQNGNLSAAQIKNSAAKLFFLEQVSYANYMAEGVLGDITDVLTTENPYDGKKIIDKFSDQQKEYYNVNDAYYGIPHYSGNNGFVYNKDLFDEHLWYFKKDKPTGSDVLTEDYFVTSAEEERGYGPNGKTGVIDGVDYSYDDGLPATYKEFIILLDYINTFNLQNFKAVTVTGKNREQYVGLLYNALVTDYEGVEQSVLSYSFDGVATDLGKIVNGEFVKDTEPTKINLNNGYEVSRQAGRYYALEFLNDIFKNKDYYDYTTVVNGSDSNVNAQMRFVRGQAAILMEGVWWESESSKSVFGKLGKSKNDYNFAWMPFPKADESKVGEETISDSIYSLCFTKNNLTEEEKKIAKDFIQFLYSDKMLSAFTRETGTLRSLDYKLTEEDYNSLTTYGKSVYNHRLVSETVYPFANNAVFRNNQADFTGRKYYATNYNEYEYVSKMLLDDYISNGKTSSPKDYFSGMYGYYQNKWQSYIK